jgi:hypothetical protein
MLAKRLSLYAGNTASSYESSKDAARGVEEERGIKPTTASSARTQATRIAVRFICCRAGPRLSTLNTTLCSSLSAVISLFYFLFVFYIKNIFKKKNILCSTTAGAHQASPS